MTKLSLVLAPQTLRICFFFLFHIIVTMYVLVLDSEPDKMFEVVTCHKQLLLPH